MNQGRALYGDLRNVRYITIDRASHTKKNGVNDKLLGLQALTKNFVLLSRGL